MKHVIKPLLIAGTMFFAIGIGTDAFANVTGGGHDGGSSTPPVSSPQAGISADAQAQIQVLTDERLCHIRAAEPFKSYTRIFKMWLTDENSRYNLTRNFNDFQAQNAKKFAEIEKFARLSNQVPETLQGLADALKAKNTAYKGVILSINNMNSEDEIFLKSLNNIESGLANLQQNLNFDQKGCQPTTIVQLDSAKKEVVSWISTAQKMRSFVTIAMRKRSTTATIAYLSSKMQMKQAYAQKAVVALNDLDKQIDQIFEASRLLDEESIWYGNAMILQGAARGWAGQKLAFEKALENLKADYVRGSKIQSKISSAQITDDQKKFVGDQVSFHLKTIQNLISEIEAGGWQKRLVPQKAITAKIISLGSQYSDKCQQAANSCSISQSHVTDLDTYREAESLYFAVVDSCFARK